MKAMGHLRIEDVKLGPGQEWSRETGPWCFMRVSSGAAYWMDPGRPRALNEGELIIVAPAIKALVRASKLGDVLLQGFNFAPELLWGFFTLSERQALERPPATEPVRFLPSTHPLTQRFVELAVRRDGGHELTERAAVLGLAIAFFTEGVSPGDPPVAHAASAHDRFNQIIARMPDVELIQHTPEQLASLCGCSPRHFNRLFRQCFGESPRVRQTGLRLLKARQLLGETDQRISQIALDSGYRSLSLFNALFRKRFGLSPSAWREKAANHS